MSLYFELLQIECKIKIRTLQSTTQVPVPNVNSPLDTPLLLTLDLTLKVGLRDMDPGMVNLGSKNKTLFYIFFLYIL